MYKLHIYLQTIILKNNKNVNCITLINKLIKVSKKNKN